MKLWANFSTIAGDRPMRQLLRFCRSHISLPQTGLLVDKKVIGKSDGLSLLDRLEAVEDRLNTLESIESRLATLSTIRIFVLDTYVVQKGLKTSARNQYQFPLGSNYDHGIIAIKLCNANRSPLNGR
jgi:hypothetical protein